MSRIGMSRDDLMRVLFEDDFCASNPCFAAHKDELLACRAAYQKSAEKSTCRCGGNPRLVFDCMDNVLAQLTKFKEENPAAVQTFVEYVGQKRGGTAASITIYYRKTGDTPLQKFKFP